MATTPMTPAQKDAAAKALCIRRGLNPDEVVEVHGANFYRWQTLVQDIQGHLDLVYIVEGRQL